MTAEDQNAESVDEEAKETQETAEREAVEDTPESEIEALKAQVAEAADQVLRSQAEMQNLRRRSEKDVENAHKFALEKFAAALLPVIDNLERAQATLDPADEATKAFSEGIELTHRNFSEVLGRFNVEAIEPTGEPFDPERHEAMSMVENDDVEPNTILQVFQKGYLLNGRVIRAAMVVVSRAGAGQQVDETA